MKKWILAALLLLVPHHSYAQLNLAYTAFQPGQTISSAQFTANFTAISANALNRTGGTMTGALTANAAVDINSTFTVGSGNVEPFDSTGKIQAISSTYFASLSGANLTGLLEANITDGSVLARVAGNETITGSWIFSNIVTINGNTGLGATANFGFASFTSPDIGRIFIGDGTGYRMHISTRAASVTSDKFTFYDTGLFSTNTLSTVGNATIGGQLLVDKGSSLIAPGLGMDGDTDTGIWSQASGDLTFSINGLTGFRVSESGGNGVIDLGVSKVGSSIVPTVTGLVDLGRTDLRWLNGYFVTARGTNAFVQDSDARLKKDIHPVGLGIEFIDALQPREFYWKDAKNGSGKQYGFIAQELQALGFEGVDASNPNRLSLKYSDLIAPLVRGVQEVHAEVHSLAKQNELLVSTIIALNARIDKLEKSRRNVE